MRIPIIAANWKMHHDSDSASKFLQRLLVLSRSVRKVEVLIVPPYTLLALCRGLLAESDIVLAGQNFYPASEGAFTGEISPPMLCDVGCEYVIVGHSERRQLFHENDAFIAQKVRVALESDLNPILCIGETFDERAAGETEKVIAHQLESALSNLELTSNQEIVIAYEPVWAIGTGETASPEDAQAGASLIRDTIREMMGCPMSTGRLSAALRSTQIRSSLL